MASGDLWLITLQLPVSGNVRATQPDQSFILQFSIETYKLEVVLKPWDSITEIGKILPVK
jgi:hypothetical protein